MTRNRYYRKAIALSDRKCAATLRNGKQCRYRAPFLLGDVFYCMKHLPAAKDRAEIAARAAAKESRMTSPYAEYSAPVVLHACAATTKTGTPCQNGAAFQYDGKHYCLVHMQAAKQRAEMRDGHSA